MKDWLWAVRHRRTIRRRLMQEQPARTEAGTGTLISAGGRDTLCLSVPSPTNDCGGVVGTPVGRSAFSAEYLGLDCREQEPDSRFESGSQSPILCCHCGGGIGPESLMSPIYCGPRCSRGKPVCPECKLQEDRLRAVSA